MKPYKLKHLPTGLYYQPHKHRGSNLSEKGKIYQSGTHGLSSALRYATKDKNLPNKAPRIYKYLKTTLDEFARKN